MFVYHIYARRNEKHTQCLNECQGVEPGVEEEEGGSVGCLVGSEGVCSLVAVGWLVRSEGVCSLVVVVGKGGASQFVIVTPLAGRERHLGRIIAIVRLSSS